MSGPAILGWQPAGGSYDEFTTGTPDDLTRSITLEQAYLDLGTTYLIAFVLAGSYDAPLGDIYDNTYWDVITPGPTGVADESGFGGINPGGVVGLTALVHEVDVTDTGATVLEFDTVRGVQLYYVTLGDQSVRFAGWETDIDNFATTNRPAGTPNFGELVGESASLSVDSATAPGGVGDTTFALVSRAAHLFLDFGTDPTPYYIFTAYSSFGALLVQAEDIELGCWDLEVAKYENIDASVVISEDVDPSRILQLDFENSDFSDNNGSDWIADLSSARLAVYPTFEALSVTEPSGGGKTAEPKAVKVRVRELPYEVTARMRGSAILGTERKRGR